MIEVWAHRGASAVAPENTLAAFARAIEIGADGIEFDVQLSADRQPVVIHDETLPRTTNGSGLVSEHTVAQLRALDASGGREGFAGVQIPLLSEVLELIAPSTLRLNIELKNSEIPYLGMEEIVLRAVTEAGLADRTVFSSFSPESVRLIAGLAPMAEVALIYSRPLPRPLRAAGRLGASALHPDRRLLPGAGWVDRAHRHNLMVRPWVANSASRMRRLISVGVDGFFTDLPDLGIAVRDEAAAVAKP